MISPTLYYIIFSFNELMNILYFKTKMNSIYVIIFNFGRVRLYYSAIVYNYNASVNFFNILVDIYTI